MGEVLAALIDGKPTDLVDVDSLILSGLLLSWDYKPNSTKPVTPDGVNKITVFDGPPRVLDIGCDTGKWCFIMKEQHRNWIIEGVDDVDRWTKEHVGVKLK